jgi:hypothetical protein
MENKKVKIESFRDLVKKLDKLCSEYVRRKEIGVCYTCGCIKEWKKMHAGHYVLRSNMQFRHDFKNLHCQCPRCNIFLHGNTIKYRKHLIKDYGSEMVEIMESDCNKPYKATRSDLIVSIVWVMELIRQMNKGELNEENKS